MSIALNNSNALEQMRSMAVELGGRNSLVLSHDQEDGFFIRNYDRLTGFSLEALFPHSQSNDFTSALMAFLAAKGATGFPTTTAKLFGMLGKEVEQMPVIVNYSPREDLYLVGSDPNGAFDSAPVMDNDVIFEGFEKEKSDPAALDGLGGRVRRGKLLTALAAAMQHHQGQSPTIER